MRTALISDIHGNLAALRAVLADIDSQRCHRIVCLGDLVDGGPSDLAVIREVMARAAACVRGNHDESIRLPPSPESAWLASRPISIVEQDVVYTHISPREGDRKVSDRLEAWNVFEETPHRLAFIGHVHIPRVFRSDTDSPGAARAERFEYGVPLALHSADRYITCPGSVGYGRDGVSAARYGIYDSNSGTVEIRRVEAPQLDLSRRPAADRLASPDARSAASHCHHRRRPRRLPHGLLPRPRRPPRHRL